MNKYGGYTNATYGNVDGVKSSYSQLAPQAKATSGVTTRTVQQNNDFNTLWNKYGAQLVGSDTKPKATGPNAEIGRTTVQPKKEKSFFEKVENQTIDLIGGKRKSLFDWIDDFSQNKGPNNETAQTVKIKASEKADLTAGGQGDKPQKPVEMYVSKDSVREKYTPTERQKLQSELLEYYGEIGRKGVEERHSLEPDASVYDTSEEIQHIIELENQLDMLDRADKAGLYDEDMSMLDRLGNTAKEWANRGLYSVDYIAQTAGTALTDYFESQLNEEYNYLINRRQDIVVQLNRITFGLDEDPYGKNEARLIKQLENINRYIDENYREKMDTTTNAYRAMERAQRYEDKAVEGLSLFWAGAYGVGKDLVNVVPMKNSKPFYKTIFGMMKAVGESADQMHEINSSGGTAGQAMGSGVTAAGIMLAAEKVPIKDLADFSNSKLGELALSAELAKHGLEISQNILEYAAKYMADLSYQNPNAQFSLSELAEEIVEDYLKNNFGLLNLI